MSMFNRLAHLFGLPVRSEPDPSPRASSSAACVERPPLSVPGKCDVDSGGHPSTEYDDDPMVSDSYLRHYNSSKPDSIAQLCERIDILEGDNQLLQQKLAWHKRALDEWTRDYNLMYTAYLNRCEEFVQQREHLAAAADGLRLAAEIDTEAPQYWLDLADSIDPEATHMTAYYTDEQVTVHELIAELKAVYAENARLGSPR